MLSGVKHSMIAILEQLINKSELKKETEGMIMTAQEQTLRTRNRKQLI